MVHIRQRVADYFIVVGRSRLKSSVDDLSASATQFTPVVLDRFPATDHDDADFPSGCPMFVFPKDIQVRKIDGDDLPVPVLHHFALTEEDGSRVYGSALVFWEWVETDEVRSFNVLLSAGDASPSVVSRFALPKCILLTTHWPFFNNAEIFLNHIFAITHSDIATKIPYERLISNMIYETPLPPRGRIAVHQFLSPTVKLIYKRPPPNKLPLYSLTFQKIFEYLSLDSIVLLFSAVVTEKRILFITDELHKLFEVIETLTYFLYPFFWHHIYIPVLPLKVIDFVCAPMPFLVGIHRSYTPDELMLQGVIVVDLDQNTICSDGSDPIPDLPDKAGSRLIKSLKRAISGSDSTRPSHGCSVDQQAVCDAFLQFFVYTLKNYSQYMEAPSEYVVDKFRKKHFLEEHAERCKFLEQFMDTQMLQCFVDSRYEATADDLLLLFFDENIERENHGSKAAVAFLEDTSNLHKTVHIVMEPYMEDVISIPTYTGWPSALIPGNFGPIRKVEPLFDLQQEVAFKGVGLQNVAMKFFADKNLYARQFHSLQVRSTKQDLAFGKLGELMRSHQAAMEESSHLMTSLATKATSQVQMETHTSVDLGMRGIIRQFENRMTQQKQCVDRLREEFFMHTYREATNCDAALKVLFHEVEKLNKESSTWKALTDEWRKNYQLAKNQLKISAVEEDEVGGELYTRPVFIVEKVKQEHDLQLAFLRKVEAESQFRKVYEVYERRMPQIVEEVRRLNGQRIRAFKQSMENYVDIQREWLGEFATSINQLEDIVSQIDVEKDISTFTEGKLDFLQLEKKKHENASTLNEMKIVSVDDCDGTEPAVGNGLAFEFSAEVYQKRRGVVDNRGLGKTFSVCLWGQTGFQTVIGLLKRSKATTKAFTLSFDELAVVHDSYSRNCLKLSKLFDTYKPPLVPSQKCLWDALLGHNAYEIEWFGRSKMFFKEFSGRFRLLKGVIKQMYNMAEEHLSYLETKLKESEDQLAQAVDSRDKHEKAFLQLEVMQDAYADDPSKSLQRIEQGRHRFKQAENDYRMAKMNLVQTENMKDISLARMMEMMQQRELQKAQEIKNMFVSVTTMYYTLWKMYENRTTEKIQESLEALDVEMDLRAFVLDLYTAKTPSHVKLEEGSTVDFAVHIGDADRSRESRTRIYTILNKYTLNGTYFMKSICTYLTERALNYELIVKLMKRSEGVISVTIEPMNTLSSALSAMNEMTLQMRELMLKYVMDIRDTLGRVEEYRGKLKTTHGNLTKSFQTILKDIEPHIKNHQTHIARQAAAQTALEKSKARLSSIETAPEKKNKLFKKIHSSVEKQTSKVTTCELDLRTAEEELAIATTYLHQNRAMETSRFKMLCKQYRKLEEDRYSKMAELLQEYISRTKAFHENVADVVHKAHTAAQKVDIIKDIEEFIDANQTVLSVPDHVVQELVQQKLAENEEDEELDLLFKRNSQSFRVPDDMFECTIPFNDLEQAMASPESCREKSVLDMLSPGGEKHDSVVHNVQTSSPLSSLAEPLPEENKVHEWKEYWDEDSQCAYYVHLESGESQWEPPLGGEYEPLQTKDDYVYYDEKTESSFTSQ